MADMVKKARWREVAGKPNPQRLGVFAATPLRDWIAGAVKDVTFDDLQTPLAVVACNVIDGTRVVLNVGPVVDAAVASAAVPGLFEPMESGDMLLADGGLVDNLPVGVARSMGVDVVVAVDVNPVCLFARRPESLRDMMETSMSIMARSNKALSRHDADFLVEPETGRYGTWDLGSVDGIIDAGREAARKVLPEVLKLLS
jgi:NTE family protein